MNTALSLILCSGFSSSAIEVVGTLLALIIGGGLILMCLGGIAAILFSFSPYCDKAHNDAVNGKSLLDDIDTIEFRFEYEKEDEKNDTGKELSEKS